jgi:hypothetical protein
MDKSKQRLRNKWDDKKGEQERVKKKNRSGRKPTRKLAVSDDTCIHMYSMYRCDQFLHNTILNTHLNTAALVVEADL